MQPPEYVRHPIAPKLAHLFYNTYPFRDFVTVTMPFTLDNKVPQRVIDLQYEIYLRHVDKLLSRLDTLLVLSRPGQLRDVEHWEEVYGWQMAMEGVLTSLKVNIAQTIIEYEDSLRAGG